MLFILDAEKRLGLYHTIKTENSRIKLSLYLVSVANGKLVPPTKLADISLF